MCCAPTENVFNLPPWACSAVTPGPVSFPTLTPTNNLTLGSEGIQNQDDMIPYLIATVRGIAYMSRNCNQTTISLVGIMMSKYTSAKENHDHGGKETTGIINENRK
jgi:hypothetical protein